MIEGLHSASELTMASLTGDGENGPSSQEDSRSSDCQSLVPSETVQDVLLTNDWLEGQMMELVSHINAAKQNVTAHKDFEMAQERISRLQVELLNESSKLSLKELTIKRIQLGSALSNELFGPSADSCSEPKVDPLKRKQVEDLVLEQSCLVSEILKEQGQLDPLRAQLKQLRRNTFEQKAKNRKAMNDIRQRQNVMEEKAENFKKNGEGQRKKAELEGEITKLIILRHTLQGLILGSGINWAKDPDMERLLLSLGESMDV